jgi:hypothetical protein
MELRVLRWWRGNDAFAVLTRTIGHPTESSAIANMERIIEMMHGWPRGPALVPRGSATRGWVDSTMRSRTLDGSVFAAIGGRQKVGLLSFIEARSRRLEILFAA